MCFSASASFTASALLIPTGIYCVREAIATNKAYVAFSLWPLFFGMQQALEGILWLAMQNHQLNLIHTLSLGFLFFSHFFWLFLTPFSVLLLEDNKRLKITLISLTIIGFIYGMLLYLPLLQNSSLFEVKITVHSINYVTRFIFDDFVPKNFSFTLYALIILIPLLISSDRKINIHDTIHGCS